MGKMQENFRKFLLKWMADNWHKNQTALAKYLGVSRQQLSNILNGHRGGSEEARITICNKLGVDYRTLITCDITESITATDTIEVFITEAGAPLPPPSNRRIKDRRNNVHQLFPEKPPVTPEAQAAHENLDIILQSGDPDLIIAIEMNLVSFRKKAGF